MATLAQMVAKYGVRNTSRILRYEQGQRTTAQMKSYKKNLSLTQPRITEALNKPRKRQSLQTAEANYEDINRFAESVDLRKYPKGVPEGEGVVSSYKATPPVYQHVPKIKGRARTIATQGEINTGKVSHMDTGNRPHKEYDDTISWPRPPIVVPRESVERLVRTAIARWGRGRYVNILIYGTFAADFGKYLVSTRFPSFKEDFFMAHVSLGELENALAAQQGQMDAALRDVPRSDRRTYNLLDVGDARDPSNFPGFAARWATRVMPVRYIEVNYIDLGLMLARRKAK
jgi:hypothetical protein